MRAAALLAFGALAPNAVVGLGDFEVAPKPFRWDALSPTRFDLAARLPDDRRAPGRDLLAEMERLVALRFDVRGPDGREYRTVGDLARAARTAKDPDAWLESVLRAAPKLGSDWGDALRELLRSQKLTSSSWDPEDDHPRDGILIAEPWELAHEGGRWTGLPNDAYAQQGAIVMYADLATIKAAENDYRLYPDDKGSSYEDIYPLDGTYVRGVEGAERDFAALTIRFRCDLPLWYGDYRCDLRILNTVDERGRLVCDIYSTSDDFHWLAGRDVYLPLDASDGARVAYLAVRQYGFDLDGVPDSQDNVREALRGSLGGLKLRAERLAGPGGDALADRGAARVPEYPVRGRR